ncbi:MAG: glycosyltransferase family 2 protein [Candidatus Binataceae bacterium]|nr:glycosyltransferase family 2 protein [Candidatus Binataceae bacterium]
MIRVSTIIPAYNGAATIRAAIDSALAQEFDGHEVIVVDDGSTDSTAQVLVEYDARIRVIHQPNRGVGAARNAGIALAQGEYIAFLDADDVWLAGHVSALAGALDANPEAVLAFGDFAIIDERGVRLTDSVFSADPPRARAPTMQELLSGAFSILPSSVALRKRACQDAGGFDEGFKQAAWEDFHLWLLLRERGPFVAVRRCITVHMDHVALIPEKYVAGRKRFLRLVRARYGRLAYGMIRESNLYFARGFLHRGVGRIKAGEYLSGARDIIRAARYAPIWVARNLRLLHKLRQLAHLARQRSVGKPLDSER